MNSPLWAERISGAMSSRESFFVIGERTDGSQSILTSHISRESADSALSMIPGKPGYVEFSILAADEWPEMGAKSAQSNAQTDPQP
jgi:hypothetical protein